MEQLKSLLEQLEEFPYPIFVEDGSDSIGNLNTLFSKYFNILNNFCSESIVKDNLSSIKNLTDKLLSIHKYYTSGSFKESYILMDELISEFKENFRICEIEKINRHKAWYYFSPLYRSRTSSSNIFLTTDDMSHISYENRYMVGSNRFSAPGTPCLYLASSSYLCWLEAGRPAYNTFNVSAFEIIENMSILDLTITASDLLHNIILINHELRKEDVVSKTQLLNENIKKFLFTFPVTLACGIKVKDHNERNRAFKEEYILPQLLLQSLQQNKIDGIKYISTNIYISTKLHIKEKFINYAFPAKGDNTTLISYFLRSGVINASNLPETVKLRSDVDGILKFLNEQQSRLENINRYVNLPTPGRFHSLPSTSSGIIMPYNEGSAGFNYDDSVFGEIENILKKELLGILRNPL